MGYHQGGRIHVPYSGSVTVSYPASERGGSCTVNYSGTAPADIDIWVETAPFDASVVNCSAQIGTLGGSVLSMGDAQVEAISNSGKKIASGIINGFFRLIGSEISQNNAAVLNKMKSTALMLKTSFDRLLRQKQTMQDDYAHIKNRYAKIFDDLDEECRRRIVELNRKAFELSERVQKEMLAKTETQNHARVLLGMTELPITRQKLCAATVNAKTRESIARIAENISQEKIYVKKIETILHKETRTEPTERLIPLVYARTDALDADGTDEDFVLVPPLSQDTASPVCTHAREFFQGFSQWKDASEEERTMVSTSFNKLASDYFASQENDPRAKRIFSELMRLKNQNEAQTT